MSICFQTWLWSVWLLLDSHLACGWWAIKPLVLNITAPRSAHNGSCQDPTPTSQSRLGLPREESFVEKEERRKSHLETSHSRAVCLHSSIILGAKVMSQMPSAHHGKTTTFIKEGTEMKELLGHWEAALLERNVFLLDIAVFWNAVVSLTAPKGWLTQRSRYWSLRPVRLSVSGGHLLGQENRMAPA